MTKMFFIILSLFVSSITYAKEIALTFDDAPMDSSINFETQARTQLLIKKLKALNVPPVIIFSNACKRADSNSVIQQLNDYKNAGHKIGNHTCTHLRLDEVGFGSFSKDAENGDKILSPLLAGQKFFRFPYLNESRAE